MDQKNLSSLADYLIQIYEKEEPQLQDKKISVNPIVSKVASLYERFRNAIDYREEEVILRAAIERIIKRRMIFGGDSKSISEPLVRELVWARYFPDESISESIINQIEEKITLYLKLRNKLITKHELNEKIINEWIYQLMSSEIEQVLNPNVKKETMINFMYQIFRKNITIADDEKSKDVQVYISIRKCFAKDDIAFLRYHLFNQFFEELNDQNLDEIASSFSYGYSQIQKQINYPKKEKILNYIKSKTAAFFILEDLLNSQKGNFKQFIKNEDDFKEEVFNICNHRYKGISSKVKRAIIRSVIFILFTKAFFALSVESTFENLIYGKIIWSSIILNTTMSPIIMIFASFFIKIPNKNNSKRIYSFIQTVLFENNPKIGNPLNIKKSPEKSNSLFNNIFTLLWIITIIITFGTISFVLTKLHFNIISQAIFIFFLAIVSFLSYRINKSANIYTIGEKPKAMATITNFLFMPFIQVGRHITEGISQVNIFLFIFDLIIEAPFKGLFAFFEQWFLFLQSKQEKLE